MTFYYEVNGKKFGLFYCFMAVDIIINNYSFLRFFFFCFRRAFFSHRRSSSRRPLISCSIWWFGASGSAVSIYLANWASHLSSSSKMKALWSIRAPRLFSDSYASSKRDTSFWFKSQNSPHPSPSGPEGL